MGDPVEPRRAPVLGLLAPADPHAPAAVVLARPCAAVFSDLIGGGLLDDAVEGACEGGRFVVYVDFEREAKDLPVNDRAAALLARPARADRREVAELRGDALVVGVDVRDGECDVPVGVLVAACQLRQEVGQRVTAPAGTTGDVP